MLLHVQVFYTVALCYVLSTQSSFFFVPIQTVSLSSLNISQSTISNLSSLTSDAFNSVSALDDYIGRTFLPHVRSLSTSLRGNQTALTNDHLLTEIADLNGEILSAVPATSREQRKCWSNH